MMNPNRAALIRLTISPPLIAAVRMVLAAVLAFAASRNVVWTSEAPSGNHDIRCAATARRSCS